jgi:prepilin-type N-terminal cleavage/methylation domain-containing protein
MSTKCEAFTLVELLVVIAIIAILAAFLFPIFASVKVAAKETVAISNAKQIGTGEILYQGDYDDQFALYFSGYVVNDPRGIYYYPPLMYWPQTISPYVSPPRQKTDGQALIQDLSPVFVDPVKGTAQQDPSLWSLGNISAWGMSDDIAQWISPPGYEPFKVSINPSEVVEPSSCLLYTETWDFYSPEHNLAGSAFASSFFDQDSAGFSGAVQFLDSPYRSSYKKQSAHQSADPKGLNITLFCDGHAKATLTGKLLSDGTLWSAGNNDLWP